MRDLHDESHLLGRCALGALDDLDHKMRSERNHLTRNESSVPTNIRIRRCGTEKSRQVERRQGIENNNLVGRVRVNALVQRERLGI